MNCPAPFTSTYLDDVLKILESASKQSLQIKMFEEDEDMLNYLAELRDTLVECYTTIVHGVKYTSRKEPLIQ